MSIPTLWPNERVFILGGGHSLKGFDGRVLRDRHCIGVNNAGLDIVPWCDILFFADRRWLEWNVSRLHLHTGRLIVTRDRIDSVSGSEEFNIMKLRHNRRRSLAADPGEVAGHCGGSSAINIAVHGGAREIVLLGFDMGGENYHSDHREGGETDRYVSNFIPAIDRMAPELDALGISVVNCSPHSALNCFRKGNIADYI